MPGRKRKNENCDEEDKKHFSSEDAKRRYESWKHIHLK